MALSRSLLRPGVFVALHTEVSGGIQRERRDLDASDVKATAPETSTVKRTETTTIVDADYHAANLARSEARSLIARVCVPTKIGLLCPLSRSEELAKAIDAAQALVAEHNDKGGCSKVAVYVAAFEVASNEEEVARAVAAQMRGLLDRMDRAITRLDPEAIREAANEARRLSTTIAPEQAAKVSAAVDAARAAAKDLVKQAAESAKRLAEGAAPIALYLSAEQKTAQACARAAFLDFSEDAPPDGAETPAMAGVRVAGLDMTDDSPAPAAAEPSGPSLVATRGAVDLSEDAPAPMIRANGGRSAGMWIDLPLSEVAS